MKLPKLSTNLDWTLIFVPIILVVAGVATLYGVTSFSGRTQLVTDQLIYIGVGAIAYILLAIFDYRELRSRAWYFYIVGLLLLILVAFFGESIFGSKRWIDLKIIQFQPSEIMKFVMIIFAAGFFSSEKKLNWPRILIFIILMIIPIYLVIQQPDLGTALTLMVIVLATILVAGVPRQFFVIGLIAVFIAVPIVWTNLKPYQKQRITSFVSPESDPLKSGYNVNQAKIAVGSGGLTGKGFGGATQSQLQFLPVAHIDFIFSGWAEATGFLGSVVLTGAFAILIWRLFAISGAARDRFGEIICIGIAAQIFFQAFVNIGMNIGLMPVTGIPLPFVSSGGTSLITTAALLGVVQSIYLRRKPLKFD